MDLPHEDELRWIVHTYARVRARCGDALASPPLVLPTGEFFPDDFRFDGPSVEQLLRRMIHHSPVSDELGVELGFVAPDGEGAGGCGSLGCGTGGGAHSSKKMLPPVQELEDGYRVLLSAEDVGSPDMLTTSLARSVGALVLYESGDDMGPDTAAIAAASEIAAVACGFGVLLANGAAVWAKSCGGLRMRQATVLPVEQVTVSLALFAAVHATKRSTVRAPLGATQREALDLAEAWVGSNPLLVESLRDRPETLEAGTFDVEPLRSALGRWWHKRRLDRDLSARPSQAPPLSEDKRRRLAEARALVDEVFGGE
jgi:hypothetical protein